MMTKKEPKTYDKYVVKLQSLDKNIAVRHTQIKGLGNF